MGAPTPAEQSDIEQHADHNPTRYNGTCTVTGIEDVLARLSTDNEGEQEGS